MANSISMYKWMLFAKRYVFVYHGTSISLLLDLKIYFNITIVHGLTFIAL